MIGIVGGGLSGLALGAFLQERGVDFRIWEAAERPGGVVRSSMAKGVVLDHGPQRTRATPLVHGLIEWAGLENEIVRVPSELALYVYRDGRLRNVPFRPGQLLRTDLLSWKGKLRVLAEPVAARSRSRSDHAPGSAGQDGFPPRGSSSETVADFFIRRFGEEAYRALLGPLFGGLYGSDPGEMYVRHALAGALRGVGVNGSILLHFFRRGFDRSAAPPAVSFSRGMAQWTDALATLIEGRLELGSPVGEIRPKGPEGWVVTAEGGEVEVETLVLTLPADAAARLLEPAAPEAARRLAALRYNDLVLVHLLGDGPKDALGYQVAYGEALRTRGVTWNAAALDREGIYTAFLGGARDPELPALSDTAIAGIAVDEFREVTAAATEAVSVSRTRIPSWDRSWMALEGLRLPPGVHLCTNYESRVGIPGRVQRALELATELAEGT